MKKKNKNGYTLIELLAVIMVLVAVGTVIASILTSVLRSSNKSANTEVVRSNGNSAIAQMSKMIEYAKKWEGVSTDGINYQTDCAPIFTQPVPTVAGLPTPTNTPTPTPAPFTYLRIKAFDDGVTTFVCANSKLASQSAAVAPVDACPLGSCSYLVDPSLNTTCYFNCSQESAAAPAKIDIFLDLKAQSSSVFSEGQADIPFETSVIIRNSAGQ